MSGTDRLNAALEGRYRIEKQLGQGGMATVYLAKDIKHDRMVAVKVLKPELAAVLGAERFVVEIKTTASLQHPHILPLFDSGTADGFLYYVMPYIEGETLRDKLRRETQFSVDEAVRITTQIADALDYAHRHGVIHRDIKPENILLHDGRPMVADFGIALAVSAAAGGRMTETGLSLGTPHYMSPEQATADKDITARSDIYSLASMLYEMLAGQPPHMGGSAQQIIMKIIAEPAQTVTAMRKSVPPNVAAALAKALEKLPADRFDSAKAFAEALGNRTFTSATLAGTPILGLGSRVLGLPFVVATAVALIAIVTAVLGWNRAPAAPPGPLALRFAISGPSDSAVLGLAVRVGFPIAEPVISPDNRYIAFSVNRSSGVSLNIRALDSFDMTEIPGGGHWPFFSPDGKTLGFFKDEEIWTVSLNDRSPARIGRVAERYWDISAVAWHPDGRILVSAARGVWSLPHTGGEATLLIPVDTGRREAAIDMGVLRDGRLLIVFASADSVRTIVTSPDGTKPKRIAVGFREVRIVDDVMFYAHEGRTWAVRFDLRSLASVGTPVSLPEIPVSIAAGQESAAAGSPPRLSRSVAWREGVADRQTELVWVDRNGRITSLGLPAAVYRWPRLSPDGRRIALGKRSATVKLHVLDLARGTSTAVGGSTEPVWAVDGRTLFSSSGNRPLGGLVRQVADASVPPDTLVRFDAGDAWPTGVSPDGKWLAFYGATLGYGSGGEANDINDMLFFDLAAKKPRRILLAGEQRGARFSPDGKWVAYESSETGLSEVHIRPWPAMDANFVISSGGGSEPAWSANGRELFYRNGSGVLAVGITVQGAAIQRTPPRVLFSGVYHRDPYGDQSWDIAPDGRFLMLRPLAGGRVEIRVALNWIDEVKAKLEHQP